MIWLHTNRFIDLATSSKSNRVPYHSLTSDSHALLVAGSIPVGVTIKDPRNMHLDSIRKVLLHCYTRQIESGPESAFRFALIIGPQRDHIPARYRQITSPCQSVERIPTQSKGKGREGSRTESISVHPPSDHPGPSDTATSPGRSPAHSDDSDGDQAYLDFATWPTQVTDDDLTTIQLPLESGSGPSRLDVDPIAESPNMVPTYSLTPDVEFPARKYPCPRPSYRQPDTQVSSTEGIEMLPSIAVLETSPDMSDNGPAESESTSDDLEYVDILASGLHKNQNPHGPEADPIRADISIPSTPVVSAKRPAAHISPVSPRRTRSKQKRKMITDDDLAAIEAQKFMAGTRRTRRIPKRA